MKEKRYYIAYGSNLNVGQMRMRCPHATILGTANLKGWELLFKGSKTGSYLTIEESEGGTVPVVIWEVTATDEAQAKEPGAHGVFGVLVLLGLGACRPHILCHLA